MPGPREETVPEATGPWAPNGEGGPGARKGEGGPAPAEPMDRVCTAAMVLGILAVAIPFAELVLGVPAILCGLAGLRRVAGVQGRLRGKGRARAGIILGAIGLLLCVPSVLILVYVF